MGRTSFVFASTPTAGADSQPAATDTMTAPHKATAEQWAQIEGYAATDMNDDYASCLLDLRARVEALEAATDHIPDARKMVTASSLVERVAKAILNIPPPWEDSEDWRENEARAAICEVAAWMRENEIGYAAAAWLEREAKL